MEREKAQNEALYSYIVRLKKTSIIAPRSDSGHMKIREHKIGLKSHLNLTKLKGQHEVCFDVKWSLQRRPNDSRNLLLL